MTSVTILVIASNNRMEWLKHNSIGCDEGRPSTICRAKSSATILPYFPIVPNFVSLRSHGFDYSKMGVYSS